MRRLKIAIMGGGVTGLTAGYYLAKKGHNVSIFEKNSICGGLASGFKEIHWRYFLERTYHHIFSNDYDILNLSKEIGFSTFDFFSPQTASLYNSRIFPVDTPQDLLKLPLLPFFDKIRAGLIVAFLKLSPFFSLYEKQTAEEFLKSTMGERVWKTMWKELFRKKFGKYAGNIIASFFWARIHKRTKRLGYPRGGFQSFIDCLAQVGLSNGLQIIKEREIDSLTKQQEQFLISEKAVGETKRRTHSFDCVISTIPTPLFLNCEKNVLPEDYRKKIKKIKYLSAINLILETDKPILKHIYWLNVCDEKIPIMGIVQHTNLISSQYYGGNNICYVANYIEPSDWRMSADVNKILEYNIPHLKQLCSDFAIKRTYLYTATFAQPVFTSEFIENKPNMASPIKNLYFANMELTYPFDRGTNYAVKLGKQVAQMI